MAKIVLKNKNLLSQDSEFIDSLLEHGFVKSYNDYYYKRIAHSQVIIVHQDLKLQLQNINNPGRDETWDNAYTKQFKNTTDLANHITELLNR